PWTDDSSLFEDLLHDPFHRVDGYGEAYSLCEWYHCCVHSYHVSTYVREWSPAISGIDGGICLDESFEDEVCAGQGPSQSAYDSHGDRWSSLQPEGVTDGESDLSNLQFLRVAEACSWEVICLHFD